MTSRHPYLIRKAFLSYTLSTFIGSAAHTASILLTSIIVGNFLGSSALSAVHLNNPIIYLLSGMMFLINIGGSSLMAAYIGKGRHSEIGRIFTTTIILNIVVGFIFFVLGLFGSEWIAGALCSDAELLPMVTEYTRILLLSAIFYFLSNGLVIFIRMDNAPVFVSVMVIIAVIIAIMTTLILICVYDTGVGGAALGTLTGQIACIGFLLLHFRKKSDILFFQRGGRPHLLPIILRGIPNSLSSGMKAARVFAMNILALSLLGIPGMATMAVCQSLLTFSTMFTGSAALSIHPVGSVIYDGKDIRGFRMLCRQVAFILGIFLAVFVCSILLIPEMYASLFGITDPTIRQHFASPAIRIFSFSLILYAINYVLMNIYQVIGQKTLALFISVLQSMMVVAAALLLIRIDPTLLWAAFTVGELLCLTCIVVSTRIIRHRNPERTGLMLYHTHISDNFDLSVSGDGRDTDEMLVELKSFLTHQGVDKETCEKITLCCKELIENICEHGLHHNPEHIIDIIARTTEADVSITIWDDGPLFNLTQYVGERNGLLIITETTRSLRYCRYLGLNAVTVTF